MKQKNELLMEETGERFRTEHYYDVKVFTKWHLRLSNIDQETLDIFYSYKKKRFKIMTNPICHATTFEDLQKIVFETLADFGRY